MRKFIYGSGLDEPICLIDVADANARYFYHCDGLGSVIALSDVNNVPVERYAYDVFGRPTIRDVNGTEIAESAFANPYLFTGRAWDAETALYYYRARYYDYFTGRFLQADPIGYADGLNVYAYVANNPVVFHDPYGLRGAESTSFWGNVWKGKYVGTGYGESALRYYAQGYVEADNWRQKFGNAVGMVFSSLWQEETWKCTVATLAAAYAADQILNSPPPTQVVPHVPDSTPTPPPASPPPAPAPTNPAPTNPAPPSEPHPKRNYRENDLPGQGGPPNDSLVKDDGQGNGQIRDYGPDGRATQDFDVGHSHPDIGVPDPHIHDWDWSKKPARQPGRPLRPGE